MPRSSYERQSCKDCGKRRVEVGHVTWRGYCIECGKRRARSQWDQLKTHSGPEFAKWRRAMAASVGAVLLDERDTEP